MLFENLKKNIFVLKPCPIDGKNCIKVEIFQIPILGNQSFKLSENFKIHKKNILILSEDLSLLLIQNYNSRATPNITVKRIDQQILKFDFINSKELVYTNVNGLLFSRIIQKTQRETISNVLVDGANITCLKDLAVLKDTGRNIINSSEDYGNKEAYVIVGIEVTN